MFFFDGGVASPCVGLWPAVALRETRCPPPAREVDARSAFGQCAKIGSLLHIPMQCSMPHIRTGGQHGAAILCNTLFQRLHLGRLTEKSLRKGVEECCTQGVSMREHTLTVAQSPAPPRFRIPPGTNSHVAHRCPMPLSEHFPLSPPRLTSAHLTVDA